MRLDELGEFGLIARLTAGLTTRPDVVLSVGDDAAALALRPASGAGAGETLLVATCDAQVEGRHFLRGLATPDEIGRKALAVNLSDVAAMGAEPLWALVSLLLPPSVEVATLDGVYAGMRELAGRYAVAIVGGNVTSTDGPLTLDITLLGRVARGRLMTRGGARPGDALLVVGTLGAAGAGLLALVTQPELAAQVDAQALAEARAALVTPAALVAAGQALGGIASAALDVSDGLVADLAHLCAASGAGARLDAGALPIAPAARRVAEVYGRDPLDLALFGGEDYALLCAVAPEREAEALAALAGVGTTAQRIGELTGEAGVLTLREAGGALRPLTPRGWDHLRRAGAEHDTTP